MITRFYIAFIFIGLLVANFESYSQPIKITICPFTSFDQNNDEDEFKYYVGIAFLGSDKKYKIDYNSSACGTINIKKNKNEYLSKSDADFILSGQYSIYGGELYISAYLHHTESKKILSITPEYGQLNDAYSVFLNFGNKVKKKINESQNLFATSKDQLSIICTSNKDSTYFLINQVFNDITQNVTKNIIAPSGLSIVPVSESSKYYFVSENLQSVSDSIKSTAVILLDMNLEENYDIIVKPYLFLKDVNTTIKLVDIKSNYYSEKDFEETLISELNYFLSEVYTESGWNYKPLQIEYDIYSRYQEAGIQNSEDENYYFSNYFFYKALGFGSQVPEDEKVFIHNYLGYNRYQLEQYDEAISELNKSLDIDANNIYAFDVLGLIYNDLGEPQNAIKFLLKADKLEKNYKGGNLYLGYNYYLIEKYDSAIFYLKSSLNSPDGDETDKKEVMRYLGYSFHNQSKYDSAIYYYEKLESEAKNIKLNLSKVYISKGIDLYYDSLFIDAIKAFNTSKEFDTQDNAIVLDYLRLCNNSLLDFPQSRRIIKDGMQSGFFKSESIYFNQAEDLVAVFYIPNNSQEVLLLIADEIFYNLDKDIEINPKRSEAYFRYGNINTSLGNVGESIKYLEKAIKYDSANIDSRMDLTEVYILNEMPLKSINLNLNYKDDGNKRNSAILTYLIIVAKIIVDEEYSTEQDKLNELLNEKSVIISNWTFDPFNSWLANTDLEDGKKNTIRELTKRMEDASQ